MKMTKTSALAHAHTMLMTRPNVYAGPSAWVNATPFPITTP